MFKHTCAVAAAVLAFGAGAIDAKPLKLKLANPQPENVTAGLSVDYAYPKDVKSLRDAYVALGVNSETGTPLIGFDYLSSDDEPMALTSTKETKVAARIKGYLRFETPGIYTLETYSNDGLELTIGGQEIAKVDAKRACDPIGAVEVNIREAGYYEVEALYWQRKGGSCLILEWSQDGAELDVVPTALYAH